MKQRIVPIFFSLILLLVSGCQTKQEEVTDPKEIAQQFLTALQNNDETTIELLSQWDEHSMEALQFQPEDVMYGLNEQLQKDAHDVMFGFSFKVVSSRIEENNAYVDVLFTTKDILSSIQEAKKVAKKKVQQAFDKNDNPNIEKIVLPVFYEAIANTSKTKETLITLALQKQEQSWIVQPNNNLELLLIKNQEILLETLE